MEHSVNANFEQKDEKRTYTVAGMSCTACALTVEKTLKKIKGVNSVTVGFTDKKAVVYYDPSATDVSSFKKQVKKAGYTLLDNDQGHKSGEEIAKKEKQRLLAAWAITSPLTVKMLLEMFGGLYLVNRQIAFMTDMFFSFLVIFIIGFPVIRATVFSLRKLAFNMDSLIGIGTLAAFTTGLLKWGGVDIENFAVVGAMIMGINLIGNYLKEMATGRASQAIKQLLELGAKNAHLVLADDSLKDVPVEELHIDDVVLVRPGEKNPVDGIIIEGTTTIDESIASGESIPVDKKIGDPVIGATLNQMGAVKVRVKKLGKNSFLAQIIKMVEEAQGTKIPIQTFADKVTSIFVPLVLLVAAGTFLFWFFFPDAGRFLVAKFAPYLPWLKADRSLISMALFASLATLVIACPCALGLATPTALMVGMGKGANNGILFRNGEAIQTAQKIDTVIFDKTGTLTIGKPTVQKIHTLLAEDDFLSAIGSVEILSEHPLAAAVARFVEKRNIKIKKPVQFSAISGKGIKAVLDNKQVIVGSLKYFVELGIDTKPLAAEISELLSAGHTVIVMAREKKLCGLVSLADQLKTDSQTAIEQLHALQIKTVMLTGDNRRAAEQIAREVGIDEVQAELLPQDKISAVRERQSKGKTVAMVGDGINDAPSLKQANIGIAIGSGTDIAIESADITLVSGSLMGVVKAIKLSQATFGKIKQNLFWAFFYNVLAIPLSVLGLLHPVIAEIAMALSSINVVTNSLRLKKTSLT